MNNRGVVDAIIKVVFHNPVIESPDFVRWGCRNPPCRAETYGSPRRLMCSDP